MRFHADRVWHQEDPVERDNERITRAAAGAVFLWSFRYLLALKLALVISRPHYTLLEQSLTFQFGAVANHRSWLGSHNLRTFFIF